MNKEALGVILGTGLLSLAKSKISNSGSVAIKIPYYNGYYFGTSVNVKLKHKEVQENMVLDINTYKDRGEIFKLLYHKDPKSIDYQSKLNSDKIHVRDSDSKILKDRQPLFTVIIHDYVANDIGEQNVYNSVVLNYNSVVLNIDLTINMMINYFSTIRAEDIVKLFDNEINAYIESFLSANPDFEVVEKTYNPFYSSSLYQYKNQYGRESSYEVISDPDAKIVSTIRNGVGWTQGYIILEENQPNIVMDPSFLQDDISCIEMKDQLIGLKNRGEYDPDENYSLALIEKYGDVRNFYKAKLKPSKLRRR